MNITLNEAKTQIEKIIAREGVELVEYKTFTSGGKLTIRCLVDYPQGGITLDKCSQLNRMIFSRLKNSLFDLDYTVEVNSPGLNRPLKKMRDFLKVKDKTVLLWFNEPVFGREFMEAKIKAVEPDKLCLDYKGKEIPVELAKIKLGKQKFRI